MRTRTTTSHRLAGLLLVASALACHSDSKDASGQAPAASGTAAAELQLALVSPSIGGNVLAVGERQVELAILENGQVLGLVYDAQGKALAGAELPQVSVTLRTQGGGHPGARLAWDGAHACLAGRAQLEAALVPQPIDVSLELNGKLDAATLGGYAILPFARFGGNVLAVGPYAVELVAQEGALLAHVLEASGKARAGAELELSLQLAGGKSLAFSWDAERARYSAALDGVLDVATQPLRLELKALGKSYAGAALSLQALAKARVDARAQLGATAALTVPAPKLNASVAAGAGAKASAKLAAPSIKVAAPKVSAKVSAPKVEVKKSVSAGTSATKAKAGAGVKASASIGFGK